MTAKEKLPGGLVGVDGNAFSIMGQFKQDAKRAGWDKAEIKVVIDAAMKGDYNNLLAVISAQYKNPAARAGR